MLGQAGQCGGERVDEVVAQTPGGPGFERAQVEFQADDRKVRVQGRPDIDGSIEDAHRRYSLARIGVPTQPPGACAG